MAVAPLKFLQFHLKEVGDHRFVLTGGLFASHNFLYIEILYFCNHDLIRKVFHREGSKLAIAAYELCRARSCFLTPSSDKDFQNGFLSTDFQSNYSLDSLLEEWVNRICLQKLLV